MRKSAKKYVIQALAYPGRLSPVCIVEGDLDQAMEIVRYANRKDPHHSHSASDTALTNVLVSSEKGATHIWQGSVMDMGEVLAPGTYWVRPVGTQADYMWPEEWVVTEFCTAYHQMR